VTISRRLMISQRILPKASVRAGGETDALDLGLKTRNDPVQQETKQRIARWRKKAAAIANRNPELNPVQIARRIQQSNAGKRKGGVLTYSITVILKYIRNA